MSEIYGFLHGFFYSVFIYQEMLTPLGGHVIKPASQAGQTESGHTAHNPAGPE